MALGRQFENTYWQDPETGDTHSWSRVPDVPYDRVATRRNPSNEELAKHQGLLFHPETGTGRKNDPLVPLERRKAEATRAVGGEDIDAYKERVRTKTGRKISSKMAQSEIDLMSEGLSNTGMPIQEMKNVSVSAFLNPRAGGGWSEERNPTIMVSRRSYKEKVDIPGDKVFKTTPSDKPIYNPKFWDWMRTNTRMGESQAQSDQLLGYLTGDKWREKKNIHWSNIETGETVSGEDAVEKATVYEHGPFVQYKDPQNNWSEPYSHRSHGRVDLTNPSFQLEQNRPRRDISRLEESGFVPNIFPGEGKPSKKVHTDPSFGIEKYYSYAKDRPIEAKVHTRFEPESAEEVDGPPKTKLVTKYAIHDKTLVHEIGHQRDSGVADPYTHRRRSETRGRRYAFADPMEEGYADGYADKHIRFANYYEDVANDPSDPARVMYAGYGVNNRQWKNTTHQALYVASRVAARTGRGDRSQYAIRKDVSKELGFNPDKMSFIGDKKYRPHSEKINTMALGKMLTTDPRLIKHLEHQGLGDVGREARSAYIDAYRKRKQANAPVQDRLPGFD